MFSVHEKHGVGFRDDLETDQTLTIKMPTNSDKLQLFNNVHSNKSIIWDNHMIT